MNLHQTQTMISRINIPITSSVRLTFNRLTFNRLSHNRFTDIQIRGLMFLAFLLLLMIPHHVLAQQSPIQNNDRRVSLNVIPEGREWTHSAEVEILGISMPYSIGYSYWFNDAWSFRLGVGYFDIKSGETNPEILEKYGESFIKATNLPITTSYFLGSGVHKLELRGGVNLIYFSSSTLFDFSPNDSGWSVSPAAGTSYTYLGKRFLASAGLSLNLAAWSADTNLLLFPGIRWGVRF